MPVNGVTGTTSDQYYVRDVDSAMPADRVASRTDRSTYNRPYSVNTENNTYDSRSQRNENTANARSTSSVNNSDIGNTIDLIV